MRRAVITVLAAVFLCVALVSTAEAAARLDAAFGQGGIAALAAEYSYPPAVLAEDGAGRLMVAGGFSSEEDPSCGSYYAARFLGSGLPDSSFGSGGLATGKARCRPASALSILPGRGAVLGTESSTQPCVYAKRLGMDGSPALWPWSDSTSQKELCFGPLTGLWGTQIDGRPLMAGGGSSLAVRPIGEVPGAPVLSTG